MSKHCVCIAIAWHSAWKYLLFNKHLLDAGPKSKEKIPKCGVLDIVLGLGKTRFGVELQYLSDIIIGLSRNHDNFFFFDYYFKSRE